MSSENKQRTYPIPTNFLDEGTILRGMFKTRNFFEALFAAGVVFVIVNATIKSLYVMAFGCGLAFLVFAVGAQGEPMSKFLLNVFKWKSNRGMILYNGTATPLSKAPLDSLMELNPTQEAILNVKETIHQRFKEQGKEEVYIEGENFRFMEDKSIKNLRIEVTEDDIDDKEDSVLLAVSDPVPISEIKEDSIVEVKISGFDDDEPEESEELVIFLDPGESMQSENEEDSEELNITLDISMDPEITLDPQNDELVISFEGMFE